MKIFYDVVRNVGYLENQSIIANGNAPTFTYSIFDTLDIQLINSAAVDTSGNFNDFYSSNGVSCQGIIDTNCTHKFDGTLNGNLSGTISEISVTMSSEPRQVGAIHLHNGTSGETVYFNDYDSITNGYKFTTSDINYTTSSITLTGTYSSGSDVEVTETPLFKACSGNVTNIGTGLFSFDVDLENVILQNYIENSCSVTDPYFEFQIFDSSTRRIMVKHFPVNILNIMDDDSTSAPAPLSNFYDKTQIDGKFNSIEFTSLIDTPSGYTGLNGQILQVNSSENGLEFAENSGAGDAVTIITLAHLCK